MSNRTFCIFVYVYRDKKCDILAGYTLIPDEFNKCTTYASAKLTCAEVIGEQKNKKIEETSAKLGAMTLYQTVWNEHKGRTIVNAHYENATQQEKMNTNEALFRMINLLQPIATGGMGGGGVKKRSG
jgi:hypothetical protein